MKITSREEFIAFAKEHKILVHPIFKRILFQESKMYYGELDFYYAPEDSFWSYNEDWEPNVEKEIFVAPYDYVIKNEDGILVMHTSKLLYENDERFLESYNNVVTYSRRKDLEIKIN